MNEMDAVIMIIDPEYPPFLDKVVLFKSMNSIGIPNTFDSISNDLFTNLLLSSNKEFTSF